jgi:hypothetical protein
MNCLSNLKFTSPTFTLIRVHPRPSALQNLPSIPLRPTASRSSLRYLRTLRLPTYRFRSLWSLTSFPGPCDTLPCTWKFHQTSKIYGPDNVQ